MGRFQGFDSPLGGLKPIVYADWTASGRQLHFIEVRPLAARIQDQARTPLPNHQSTNAHTHNNTKRISCACR